MLNKKKKLEPVAPGAGKFWDVQHFRYLTQLGVFIFIAVTFVFKQIFGETTQASPEAF